MKVTCNKCGSENTDTAKFCNGCGGGLHGYSPDGDLVHGTLLDCRYEIIDLLKKGGMGAVYAAKDRKFDTVCAIKELRVLGRFV